MVALFKRFSCADLTALVTPLAVMQSDNLGFRSILSYLGEFVQLKLYLEMVETS